jgi:beta-galactosidase/beta-glucuronidase
MSLTNNEPEALRSLSGSPEEEQNPLPRSVIRPNSFVLLDGTWNFALDPNNSGIEDGWARGHNYHQQAAWPGSIESFMGKDVRTPRIWHNEIIVWYERTFSLPSNGQPGSAGPGQLLQLTFGACGYETRVWLNGTPLKTVEGADYHVGEYTSFSFELPDELLQEENRLTVRIADSMDADTARGKQESHVYKRGGIWYQTSSGATRSVWLEPVERNRLRSRVGVVSVVEDNLVRVNLTTRIHDAGEYILRLKVYELKQNSDEPIAIDQFPLHLEEGQKQQRVMIEIPGAEAWSPENPHLYRLVAQLEDISGHIAQIETQIGLRKIESRGRFIYLNNKPIYLDGILYQPGDASYEEIKRHMYAMKKLGCNLVRIHIAGVDPRIYHLADRLGLLLWVEVPSPHASNPRSRANHRAELLRMLALIESHPSVIIWSLYNEDWGIQDVATNAETRQYIIDTYHYMQINHPQFLVIDNDGWQHISLEGRLKSDLLTAHLYTPDISRWRELLDAMVSGQLTGVAVLPLTVGDPFFYRKQVPLIVSEWGGFGFSDYGGPAANADRAALIKSFKDELRRRHIAGDVYTQATDIEDERNGIIDMHTGALKVPPGLLHSEAMDDVV